MSKRYAKSIAAYERACRTLAGGVSSSVRKFDKPVPLYFDHGEGAHLFDIDGNRYVDYVLGRGPLILGHSHPAVIHAVEEQLWRGQIYAAQHVLEYEMSERVVAAVPSAELVRFGISGSEAVHGALRLARAYTGRQLLVKFEGQYHGWLDNVLYSLAPDPERAGDANAPAALPESPGQFPAADSHLVILPWNNLDVLAKFLAEHAAEVAAVITEPVMCNTAVIPPLPGFLEGVRELCSRYAVVLIFDEVITGFRLSLGGAQGRFGITPDLSIFGKAIANGMPISCLAGKTQFMELIAQGKVGHGGTYNSIPPAVAGGVATLDLLAEDNARVYAQMESAGNLLMEGIRNLAQQHGIPVVVQGYPQIFYVGFPAAKEAQGKTITDYRSSLRMDHELYNRFVCGLMERGVRVIPRGNWFLCSVLQPADIDQTLQVVDEVFAEVIAPALRGKAVLA